MYRIGLIEDDLMMQTMISERLGRVNTDSKSVLEIIPVEFDYLTLQDLVDVIYEQKFDAIVIDHKLKSTNTDINYEGTDIALEIESIIHFFPVFILTSYDLDAESKKYTDVNKVYKKEKYIEDEKGDVVDSINRKIIKQIEHYKERLKAAEDEIYELRIKPNLTNDERDRLLQQDHLIEKSMTGRHHTPLILKNNDEKLQELLDIFSDFIVKSDKNGC
ncbi:hypothetical protein [Neobacillus sp. PS3-40]|uniref:hypothetical protein n=1 Tax=Neobacillus sp. PS3-40 TaxID=3070679 RepID=UPI0027DF94E6|nr:hypothetical protein [Neobacillus sp. PS3-40]WML42641.1 hypothetical protein RCG20_12300 [Neobacillus sp. PS3-40]